MRALIITFLIFLFSNPLFSKSLDALYGRSIYYLPDPIYKGNYNPYIESYWQINPKSIHFITIPDKGIVAQIQVDVVIKNDTGKVMKEDSYIYQTVPCNSILQIEKLNIIELKRYLLAKGKMHISLVLTDLNDTTSKYVMEDTFTVSPNMNAPFYGDAQLVDTVLDSDVKSPFRKHGKQFLPMYANFYDQYRGTLNFYNELYNLSKISKSDFPLLQSIYISRKETGTPYTQYLVVDTIQSDTSAAWKYGTFDISKLPTGNYNLNFSLGTNAKRTLCSSSVFFQRLNPVKVTMDKPDVVEKKQQTSATDSALEKVTIVDISKTFIEKYDMNQTKAILKMLKPVVSVNDVPTIEGFLKNPDEIYMKYFIFNYFSSLNKDKPEKAWKEFGEKVKQVNKLFTVANKPGYETDRGFMYLRYGAPSEIISAPNERGTLPYEIWQYNNLMQTNGKGIGNAVILFYKKSNIDDDFKVLHTTIAGEIKNIGWRSFVYISTDGSSDDIFHKAEQYIGNR